MKTKNPGWDKIVYEAVIEQAQMMRAGTPVVIELPYDLYILLSTTSLVRLNSAKITITKSQTSIDPGVHEIHCCAEHGCKYGNDACPVENKDIKQRYPCEGCEDDEKLS